MSYKPRTQKRIQNLSRAINKMDRNSKNTMKAFKHRIDNVEPGINTVKYRQDGVRMEISYSDLENLNEEQQASLSRALSIQRYEIRQERAIEQLRSKGKISWQFKRSLEKDAKLLLNQIESFEEQTQGNNSDIIANEFQKIDQNFVDWEQESDDYFNDPEIGTPELLEFYSNVGFEELNAFTWNSYKMIKGI